MESPESTAKFKLCENFPAENIRSEGLFLEIEFIQKMHKRLADPSITDAIDALLHLLKSQEIAVADRNFSGNIWNRKSILGFICETFDPPLSCLIPEGSLASIELIKGGASLPLINHLSKKNLRKIADNLKLTAQVLEEFFYSDVKPDWGDGYETMTRTGESLSVVAEILDAVLHYLPIDSPRWCNACFRRALTGSKYCRLHSPSPSADSDTAYRKAKKLKEELPPEMFKMFGRYFAKRRLLGEFFYLVSDPVDVSHSNSLLTSFIVVFPEMKALVDESLQSPWPVVSANWEKLFAYIFQHTSCLLKRRPSEFNTWDEFAVHILDVLNDIEEDTRHPFWILNIIYCAEEWLKAEFGKKDGRKTETSNMVIDLFRNGVVDPEEIALRIGKSKTYVYRVIKDNYLRK